MKPRKRPGGGVFLAGVAIAATAWLFHYSGGELAREAGKAMRDEVERGAFSGVALVTRGGRVIFEEAYGLADVERDIPNTPGTKFRIASITKSFTAVLVMQLEQQGRLSLEDRVEGVTIHQLLSHTSGIDGGGYSNTNYHLLGSVIEKVTGESYETVLRRQILDPLGMKNTGIVKPDATVAGLAKGYRRNERGRLDADPDTRDFKSYASGSIYSTVEDLAKLSEALDSETLLPRATVERMWTAVADGYGYGWQIPSVSPFTSHRRVVEHRGRVPGFTSILRRFVDEDLTVIVLANRIDADPVRAAVALSATAFGEPFVSVFDRPTLELPAEVRRRYVGGYEANGQIYTIFERDGQLFLRAEAGGPQIRLLAEAEDVLFISGVAGSLQPIENRKGEVTGLVATLGGSGVTARKVRAPSVD